MTVLVYFEGVNWVNGFFLSYFLLWLGYTYKFFESIRHLDTRELWSPRILFNAQFLLRGFRRWYVRYRTCLVVLPYFARTFYLFQFSSHNLFQLIMLYIDYIFSFFLVLEYLATFSIHIWRATSFSCRKKILHIPNAGVCYKFGKEHNMINRKTK